MKIYNRQPFLLFVRVQQRSKLFSERRIGARQFTFMDCVFCCYLSFYDDRKLIWKQSLRESDFTLCCHSHELNCHNVSGLRLSDTNGIEGMFNFNRVNDSLRELRLIENSFNSFVVSKGVDANYWFGLNCYLKLIMFASKLKLICFYKIYNLAYLSVIIRDTKWLCSHLAVKIASIGADMRGQKKKAGGTCTDGPPIYVGGKSRILVSTECTDRHVCIWLENSFNCGSLKPCGCSNVIFKWYFECRFIWFLWKQTKSPKYSKLPQFSSPKHTWHAGSKSFFNFRPLKYLFHQTSEYFIFNFIWTQQQVSLFTSTSPSTPEHCPLSLSHFHSNFSQARLASPRDDYHKYEVYCLCFAISLPW